MPVIVPSAILMVVVVIMLMIIPGSRGPCLSTPPAPPPRRDPVTDVEWQEAVDAATFHLLMDSARQFGLITGGPKVNVGRCEEIIARGKKKGIVPSDTDTIIRRHLRGS